MTSAEGIVDWNELSLNEGVQALAKLVRRHLKARVYVVTLSGEVMDLTPREESALTVFDHLAVSEVPWDSDDGTVSFIQLVKRWTEDLEAASDHPGEVVGAEFWPGFQSRMMPIVVGGAVRGAVVVAGYVPTEKAAAAVEAIRRALPTHLREAIDSGEGPEITQLPRESRRWVDRLVASVAQTFGEELEEGGEELLDQDAQRFGGMLGKSAPMKRLFRDIRKVARTNSTVLITGENGTGKELVARAVHRLSHRQEEPFIAVNCAAIPADLIASELFGHVKGAFSSAHRDRKGLFEAADGGTLLLDEIGDMEHPLQTKLLRVLQEGTLVRVGDTEVRKVDVRVICATNRDLEEMVRRKEFRRDLFFRIRVIQLKIPPLRARGEDIALLAKHFVTASGRRHGMGKKVLAPEALEQLIRYAWPGNVRELENEIERLVIMSGEDREIGTQWLRTNIAEAPAKEPTLDFDGFELPEAIEFVERRMILETLRRTGWNKSQTARELGVSRRNLIRKVARYELEEGQGE